MTAPTDVYVDAALAADVGTGDIGDPYGDIQYALNTATRDATNGNRFLLKSGVDEVMTVAALSLATYGTPTGAAPLIFEGYSTTPGDGNLNTGVGIAGISGNGSNAIFSDTTKPFITFKHLRFHNCGAANIVTPGADSSFLGCQFDNTTGSGIILSSLRNMVIGCYFTNIATYGISASNHLCVFDSFFKNGTNDFTACLIHSANSGTIERNFFYIDGASDGIVYANHHMVRQNSILCLGGSGSGIRAAGATHSVVYIQSNLVEGFTTGYGINYNTPTRYYYSMNNSCYNNGTAFGNDASRVIAFNNETLLASPFAKEGDPTFANRFTFFAPVDVGNVLGGAYVGG